MWVHPNLRYRLRYNYVLSDARYVQLTRSICWSLDWQRAGRVTQGRVILSQQLVG